MSKYSIAKLKGWVRLSLVTSPILGIILMGVFINKSYEIILYRRWTKPDVVTRQTVARIIEKVDIVRFALELPPKPKPGGKVDSATIKKHKEELEEYLEKRPLCEIEEIIWTEEPAPPSLKWHFYMPAWVLGFLVGYVVQFSIMMLMWLIIAKVAPWIKGGFELKSDNQG